MAAFSKARLYDQKDHMTSEYFKAFGHPGRMRLIDQLLEAGPCNVGALHRLHPISKPSLSRHLRILRRIKIVEAKESFPFTIYNVNRKNYSTAVKMIKAYFARNERKNGKKSK
ncbi:MAG: helix-turn-helix domain-containing protein [Saprospiraceae bacterium]